MGEGDGKYEACPVLISRITYTCPECEERAERAEETATERFGWDPGGYYTARGGDSDYLPEELVAIRADKQLVPSTAGYACPTCKKVWRIVFEEVATPPASSSDEGSGGVGYGHE